MNQIQRHLKGEELYDKVLRMMFDEDVTVGEIRGKLDAIRSLGKIEGRLTAIDNDGVQGGPSRRGIQEGGDMSMARDRIHVKYCPDIDEKSLGAVERKKCENLDYLLNQVEDDRVHSEAEKLRERANEFAGSDSDLVAGAMAAATRAAADSIDPYEFRGGQLVRKSDGKLMHCEKCP